LWENWNINWICLGRESRNVPYNPWFVYECILANFTPKTIIYSTSLGFTVQHLPLKECFFYIDKIQTVDPRKPWAITPPTEARFLPIKWKYFGYNTFDTKKLFIHCLHATADFLQILETILNILKLGGLNMKSSVKTSTWLFWL
jgi:hypothetical protein